MIREISFFCPSVGFDFEIARYGKMPDGVGMVTATAHADRSSSSARLEARVSQELKDVLEQAAAITGHATLTSYLIVTLQTKARRDIEEHQQAKLTAQESRGFVQALLAPPAPNAALRSAFKRYRGATKA